MNSKATTLKLAAGATSISVDVSRLVKGMDYLDLKGETINERRSFIKQ